MDFSGKKVKLFFCFLLVLVGHAFAQKNRFIYIQTENSQPFYVKLDQKLFSSSVSGYLIIPKLSDGTYKLAIGFPKNEWPLQIVTCAVKENDAGYLLKNFRDKGWGLLNMQNMQLTMAVADTVGNGDPGYDINEDKFSAILAAVVNDPGILKRPRILMDTLKTESKTPDEITVLEEKNSSILPGITKIHTTDKNRVLKLVYENVADGINLSYLDINNDNIDTVNVFIAQVKPVVTEMPEIKTEKPVSQTKKINDQPGNTKFIDMELPNPNLKKDTVIKPAIENIKCKGVAAYNDFLDLRKLMTAEISDSIMINAALKKFTTICFTTQQVKDLGDLFITDEGKYKFFVAAYPFVSDLSNYGLLETQLSNEYFISRFKAMLVQKAPKNKDF